MSFKITWKTHLICLLLALVVTQAMGSIVDIIINRFFSEGLVLYPTNNYFANFYIDVALFVIPISIMHELLHGMAYKFFGGKVKYGFRIIYAYTHEVSELALERSKFLIVLLAPVVAISLISLFLPPWLGGMVYLLNLLGSIGDIYMAFVLCRYRYDSRIIDRKYGFDVI